MDVTSATSVALRAPYPGTPFPEPGPQPEVDESRSVADVGVPAPSGDTAPEPAAVPASPKSWMAWFDLNGDGLLQNFPVSQGGDAYMPGIVETGRRAVPVHENRPHARLKVPGDPAAAKAAEPHRLQRAAETYRRDGGEHRAHAVDHRLAEHLGRLIETVERQVASSPKADETAAPANAPSRPATADQAPATASGPSALSVTSRSARPESDAA